MGRLKVVDTKCFFLCWKCLKIVEAMRDCEISGVKTKTGLLLKKKKKMCIRTSNVYINSITT